MKLVGSIANNTPSVIHIIDGFQQYANVEPVPARVQDVVCSSYVFRDLAGKQPTCKYNQVAFWDLYTVDDICAWHKHLHRPEAVKA